MKKRLLFLLFFPFSTFAEQNQVKEDSDFYWIDVVLASLPKTYEQRVAVSKAKFLLTKHLNLPDNSIEFEYKSMLEISRQRNAELAAYTFKLAKQSMRINIQHK